MLNNLKISGILLLFFSVITGVVYPMVVTLCAQILFPYQANGSLIRENNKIVGSELIGQHFLSDKYFHGRLSFTSDYPYNPLSSAGSNLSQSNPELYGRRESSELMTSSGSGLDPHISPATAYLQVGRIAKARKIDPNILNSIIKKNIEYKTFGFLGENRINFLRLNLQIDKLKG